MRLLVRVEHIFLVGYRHQERILQAVNKSIGMGVVETAKVVNVKLPTV